LLITIGQLGNVLLGEIVRRARPVHNAHHQNAKRAITHKTQNPSSSPMIAIAGPSPLVACRFNSDQPGDDRNQAANHRHAKSDEPKYQARDRCPLVRVTAPIEYCCGGGPGLNPGCPKLPDLLVDIPTIEPPVVSDSSKSNRNPPVWHSSCFVARASCRVRVSSNNGIWQHKLK